MSLSNEHALEPRFEIQMLASQLFIHKLYLLFVSNMHKNEWF